jgi:glyoxylate reductase
MKLGAVIVNTARGSVIDEAALIEALSSGKIRAGLDVYEQEPLAQDSPLLAMDNVVLMPHLGSATAATRQAMMERAYANLVAGLEGKPLPWCANPEVYTTV